MGNRPHDVSAGIPDALRPDVDAQVARLEAALGSNMAAIPRDRLANVFATSEFAADIVTRQPGLFAEMAASGRLESPSTRDQYEAAWQARSGEDSTFLSRLRWFRHSELVRIVWRDAAGLADVETSLHDLSALADTCISAALDFATRSVGQRHGHIRWADGSEAPLIVLAMGKLGGGELNFSSDVDLVFLYTGTGETDGSRPVAAEQYYRLIAQRTINALNQVTADGFVYRVDVRLRPFGDSGPLVVSVPAFETYLMQHGRDWERYAYLKARVVNPWPGAQDFYDEVLRPFCYRRYLDYGVFGSLRDMKALIEAEGRRREYRDHLKLGPGGIREIEFIVQSLQLVRGGTVPELRERRLLRALEALVKHDCMERSVADDLAESYLYLRSIENRLQAIRDEQTHDLPVVETNQARLALAMCHEDWTGLRAEVDGHRDRVQATFRDVVFRSDAVDAEETGAETALWSEVYLEGDDGAGRLAALGYADPDAAIGRLSGFHRGALYRRIDQQGRERLDRLVPALVEEAAGQAHAGKALDRCLRVLESIGRRAAYFALLNENPSARTRLVGLCGWSDFLTARLCAHPLLLDELLDPRIFTDPPTRSDLEKDLEQRLATTDEGDTESILEVLRNFQQAAVFRIAVADLSGALPVMKVSDRLTETAELVLGAAQDAAWQALTARHGVPSCRDGDALRPARFGIVGYGKLGGLELGYGSDLDIVFVHDSTDVDARTDGEHPLENAVFFGRLVRRIIHTLTMPTMTGELYEVDTRLRPSGKSGLLVTSLAAFERYQQNDAWTWEHQALLRSRAVAGEPALREAFESLRKRVLIRDVRREGLAEEVSDMRARMRNEIAREREGHFDLKQGRGGIADIEFLVQYLVLREASSSPALVEWSDNVRQLDALEEAGLLKSDEAGFLRDTYIAYRESLHRRSLAGGDVLVAADEFVAERERVATIWDAHFG